MAQQITNLRPTTELDAVNAMLAAIGEAPLAPGTDLATATQADVEMALNILRDSTREVQAMGWRFNTESGVEIKPTTTYSWTDSDAVVTVLNIFKRPVDCLVWEQTACSENGSLDLVERPSRGYVETAKPALVLYDRALNRDGAEAARYPFIYLDTVSAFDFEMCPESARRFITVKSARVLAQNALGSETLRNFTAQDELNALRILKRDQGLTRSYNILDNAGSREALGGRPRPSGGYSVRVYPGKQ